MMRQIGLALIPVALFLLIVAVAGISAEGEPVKGELGDEIKVSSFDEATARGKKKGGGGYSQQYHYNAHPSHDPGPVYAGISFDLSTGLTLAIGAILVLLALAAVCYPLLNKKGSGGGGGDGWGWDGSSYGTYRSLNLAGMSEKVLNAVEKAYELYNISKSKTQ